jgi:hypothetical protein
VPAHLRRLTLTAACGAALVMPMAAALPASAAPAAAAIPATAAALASPAAPASKPGKGKSITLANKVTLSEGYDAATSSSGTTYIGWIGNIGNTGRKVYLCVLPRGKSSCAGGIKSTASLGSSSASGLRVLLAAGGGATLVWSHNTVASENGPNGDEITTATAGPDGSLSAAADVATGPSFGTMLDAVRAPDGSIWVTTEPSSGSSLQVRPGLSSAAVSLHTPYTVGNAGIAFSGSTAVLAIQKGGAITLPVAYAHRSGSTWSAFHTLARTWTSDANLGIVRTTRGIRVLASINNADFWPVVSRWTGSGFSARQLTGDRNNCAPNSHDPVADASGRMADVSRECSNLAVANLSDTLHAAVVRFGSGGTFAGGNPQITTTPRGRGWVVWSIESSVADKLIAAPILLPSRTRTVSKTSHGDRVRLTGPASCLTPATVHVGVTGSPAAHWRVLSRSVRLHGKALGTALNGASLTAGASEDLTGRVVFADGGARRTVTATLTFRTCPNP